MNNMVDLTPILNATIALAAAFITAFVIPWLKRKTDEQEREELLKWVDIAVMAAQQLYHQQKGEQRKAYVLDFLAGKGYDVNSEEVDNAIEAAVLQLHQALEAAG